MNPECKHCGTTKSAAFKLERSKVTCKLCNAMKKRSNIAGSLYNNAKRRAAKKGIDFTITVDDIVVPEKCPILGIDLEMKPYQQGNNQQWSASPSLDRIDPSKGYTPDNIQVVSEKANRIKADGTVEEHILIAAYMINNK